MKKVYLLQLLLHEKDDFYNYAYYDSQYHASIVGEALLKEETLKIDLYRIKEINVY